MNRFSDSQGLVKSRGGKLKAGNILIFILFFCLIMYMFNVGIDRLTHVNEQQQLESVHNAVVRAVIVYYAIEGRFPPSIDYLVLYHNLVADQNRFIIHYNLFADNIMPHISVFERDF